MLTGLELSFCASAVLCSSISQLILKAASARGSLGRVVILLSTGAALRICSVFLAVVALRTMNLSQLVSIGACAYVLVPLGSHFFLGERLLPRFWIGALLIMLGILCTAL